MLKRLKERFKRKPDFIIGDKESPYLLRWYLIPQNRFFNIYLHRFLRDDFDRATHDHPFYSLSFASGEYLELIATPELRKGKEVVCRKAFRPVFRKATHIHRIILFKDAEKKPIPVWTLFITGPKVREWGFWCERGWRHWKDFVDERDHGKVGKGCE